MVKKDNKTDTAVKPTETLIQYHTENDAGEAGNTKAESDELSDNTITYTASQGLKLLVVENNMAAAIVDENVQTESITEDTIAYEEIIETETCYENTAAMAGNSEEETDTIQVEEAVAEETAEAETEAVDTVEWIYNYDTEEWEYKESEQTEETEPQEEYEEETVTISSENYPSAGQKIVDYAMGFVGVTPYVWAGNSLYSGTDCSGFVSLIYDQFGIYCSPASLSYDGSSFGYVVSADEARAGDIAVYGGGNHVAIYAGNGYVVHCSNPEDGTVYWNMNYRSDLSWFLRVTD